MSAYPPWSTLLVSGTGVAEATVGTLATVALGSQGNSLGVYVQNNDATQTVTFTVRARAAPGLEWIDVPSLLLQDVPAVGGAVYQVLPLAIPVSGALSLQLRAVASGAGSAPVVYRAYGMEVR